MKILAVEFSSPQRSVAIAEVIPSGTAKVLSTGSEAGTRSVKALVMIDSALRTAGVDRTEIDCIAVGLGPGSYAGIRAAIALAKGWQLARGVKVLGVSSAECLARRALAEGITGDISIAIDAQRSEFYAARYRLGESAITETEALRIVPVIEIQSRIAAGETVLSPEAPACFAEKAKPFFPDAATVALIAATRGDSMCADALQPIYLREVQFVKAPPPRFPAR